MTDREALIEDIAQHLSLFRPTELPWAEIPEARKDMRRNEARALLTNGLLAEQLGQEPVDTWLAVVADRDGFVMDDELLRSWCKATEEGKTGWQIPCEDPYAILIVTGTSRPEPQSDAPDEDIFRLPSIWTTEDRFLEIDVSGEETGAILRQWERAVAVAEAMNAAGVQ